MKYDIYFHNDFDGRASAAVMLAFLRKRGDTVGRYVPLDLGIKPKWPTMKIGNPSIVVDFPYHPKATFWFDHHETSFAEGKLQKSFRTNQRHFWEPSYPSCCSLVLDTLTHKFGFKAPKHLKELARWLDVIDGANYQSAKEALRLDVPAVQISYFIERHVRKQRPLEWLIQKMSRSPVGVVAKDARVRKGMRPLKKAFAAALSYYRRHLQIFDRVGYLDLTKRKLLDIRFAAPYYLEPRLLYAVVMRKHPHEYGIGIGVNPWRRKEAKVNVGLFLKRYGGGGHKIVGGARFATKKEAEKTAREAIMYLKKR